MPSATTPGDGRGDRGDGRHGPGAVPGRVAHGVSRSTSGSRAADLAQPASTSGISRIIPRTAGIALAAIRISRHPCAPAPQPAPDTDSTESQDHGDLSEGARSPRRPARTATTSCREARCAGTTAARKAPSSPKRGHPREVQPRHLEGSELGLPTSTGGQGSAAGPGRCRARTPSYGGDRAEHDRADEDRRGAPATACRRRPPSTPGCAAACGHRPRTPARRAGRPRAGPSRRSARARRRRVVDSGWTPLGDLRDGGGSVMTARDVTIAPIALSASTWSHDTWRTVDQPGPATGSAAIERAEEPDGVGKSGTRWSSAMPDDRRVDTSGRLLVVVTSSGSPTA